MFLESCYLASCDVTQFLSLEMPTLIQPIHVSELQSDCVDYRQFTGTEPYRREDPQLREELVFLAPFLNSM